MIRDDYDDDSWSLWGIKNAGITVKLNKPPTSENAPHPAEDAAMDSNG